MQVNAAGWASRFPVVALEEKKVSWNIIRKPAADEGLLPNLRDYDAVREAFTWAAGWRLGSSHSIRTTCWMKRFRHYQSRIA
jgi:hypothetical protein